MPAQGSAGVYCVSDEERRGGAESGARVLAGYVSKGLKVSGMTRLVDVDLARLSITFALFVRWLAPVSRHSASFAVCLRSKLGVEVLRFKPARTSLTGSTSLVDAWRLGVGRVDGPASGGEDSLREEGAGGGRALMIDLEGLRFTFGNWRDEFGRTGPFSLMVTTRLVAQQATTQRRRMYCGDFRRARLKSRSS